MPEQVRDPQRLLKTVEVVEDLQSRRPMSPDSLGLFGGKAGGEEVPHPSGLIKEGDHPVAGLRESTCRVQHLLQHRVEVEALVDAQTGLAQPGQPFPQGLDLSQQVVLSVHSPTSNGARDRRCSRPSRPAEWVPDCGLNRRDYTCVTHTLQQFAQNSRNLHGQFTSVLYNSLGSRPMLWQRCRTTWNTTEYRAVVRHNVRQITA